MRVAARRKRLQIVSIIVVVLVLALAGWFLNNKSKNKNTTSKNYDVVVVGAGPGGIAAALQAARMGQHVALLEETDWIGGQMTAAGVGTMDEGNVAARKSGVYKEFVDKATAYYKSKGKSAGTCYFSTTSLCVDPSVGQQILRSMLQTQSKNLDVQTGVRVSSVLKQGNTVTGVVANGTTYSSKVLVDADEYGDILAKAGAAFRLSNGTSDQPTTTGCVQSITNAAVIKYYPNGVPQDLRFKKAPPGYSAKVAAHFAQYLKADGIDHFVSKTQRNLSFKSYAAFRGFPDLTNTQNYNALQQNGQTITRTSLNLGNDFPAVGNLPATFISEPDTRQRDICDAKLLTLQMVYYIQHDMGETNWSLANDEGYDTAYNRSQGCKLLSGYTAFEDQMPQEPYVREARRLVGTETLAGDKLQYAVTNKSKTPTYPDSIAVGYYPMDVHSCHTSVEAQYDSISNLHQAFSGGAFEVPMGVMIPQKLDGLLAVEKNISASRFAEGAIREQPIAMDIGQAAGVLASLSIKQHVQPRKVSAQAVQQLLQQNGAVTTITAASR